MRRMVFGLFNGIGVITMVLALAVVATAQFRAGVQGVVTDSNGATVPGATVTLTNKSTNQTQKTVTNNDGFYRFSALPPSIYSVAVDKDGFSKTVVDDVNVEAEAIKGQNITLQTGSIDETVTVEADTVALQTEDANIRKTITTKEILQLPQIGRDPYELIRLTPGIVGLGARDGAGGSVGLPNTSGRAGSNTGIFQTESMQPISANGQRGSSNNYQIDGVSVNSQNWGGSAIITPSQEIVKEVQVLTTSYSAEDGRNSGAQIKTITQSGTNDWHGSLFYKYNDPSLNAFNKMPTSIAGVGVEGPRKVLRKFRSFGGSFGGQLPFLNFGEGGPFIRSGRDKSWFFFAYEGTRDKTNDPYYSWVETSEFRNAIASQRAGTVTAAIVGAPGGDPRILEVITPRLTAANRWACGPDDSVLLNNFTANLVGNGIDFGSLTGTYGNYAANNTAGNGLDGIPDVQCGRFDNERTTKGDQFFGRVDFQLTDAARLAITATVTPFNAGGMDSAAQSRPQADFFSDRTNFATAVIYNHTFTPTFLMESRLSYSGWGYDEMASNPHADFGIPRIEVEQIWGGRLRWGIAQPGMFKDRQYDFKTSFTNISGNHVFKFGMSYNKDSNEGGNMSRARPLFSFARPWNFANGTPVFESVGANPSGKPTPDDTIFHSTGLAFFVQDDWKMLPNFTLNLGLRWEYLGPIVADRNVISNLVLDANGGTAGATLVVNDTLTKQDWNNFGPQIGFAWSPERFGNKLVIRGGTGLAYDRLPNALLNNARRNPGGPTQLYNICCPGNSSDPNFLAMNYSLSGDGSITGFPVHGQLPAVGRPEIYGSPWEVPNASVWRYSLEAQYELPWRTVATVGYSGTRGKNFVRIEPKHITGGSNSGASAFGAVYYAVPDVVTNYNAMISSVRTRFFKGLSFIANYTFGKSLDTVSWEAPCACTNQTFPVDQDEEYGRSDFDTRHNMNFAAVWDIPFFSNQRTWQGKIFGGWQLGTIVTYNTGYPWTARTAGCLQGATTGTSNFCDPRPTYYNGTAPRANTNENFLNGGLFPGTFLPGVPCNNLGTAPDGCNTAFFTPITTTDPFTQPPGVGRNTFFGPKYFSTDISIGKRFGLPNTGFWGEGAGLDLKFNFFNVFNQLNFAPFGANSNPTHVDRAQFALPTNGLSGRVGEFQARLSF
ncbi:MAG: carboxypeptidase regulatory-like domain-containing protein [Acidobacteria bacterium]|nr:carboxypeptidase regulatory-like domain-containing protein [Acidobacteriota bacterium]